MALTRKFLTALGIEADKVDEIITAHAETVDALKAERDQFKADAEKLPAVQKELDGLKAAEKGSSSFEVKYKALKEEFDGFKKDVEAKETKSKKEVAFRALLKEVGVSEKRLDAVVRVTDLDSVKLDDEGKIENAAELKKGIKEEWSDFSKRENVQNKRGNHGNQGYFRKTEGDCRKP